MTYNPRWRLLLCVVPASIVLMGCEEERPQYDVYLTQEDCVRDWGDERLCQEVPGEQQPVATSQTSHGGSTFVFWGPGYFSGARGVNFNGSEITPKSNGAVRQFVPSAQSASSVRAPISGVRPITRGGFGATARGFSAGG
jgi:uncharacterized protein YgiB involved in biofilm formation